MPLDKNDMADAYLAGKALFEEWKAGFEEMVNHPNSVLKINLMIERWDSMTPDEIANLKATYPQDFAKAENMIAQIKKGGLNGSTS